MRGIKLPLLELCRLISAGGEQLLPACFRKAGEGGFLRAGNKHSVVKLNSITHNNITVSVWNTGTLSALWSFSTCPKKRLMIMRAHPLLWLEHSSQMQRAGVSSMCNLPSSVHLN